MSLRYISAQRLDTKKTPQPFGWGVLVDLAFYRASQHTANEIPLERKEYGERQEHGDKSPGCEQMPVLSFFANDGGEGVGDNSCFLAEKDKGNKIVIPDPQELEDGEGCE